jgi:hypothetical protein
MSDAPKPLHQMIRKTRLERPTPARGSTDQIQRWMALRQRIEQQTNGNPVVDE